MLVFVNFLKSSEIELIEIIKSKKDYFANYFTDCSNNIKTKWQGIRAIINIKNPTVPKIAQLNVKGRIFDNPKEIAERLMISSLTLGLIQKRKYQKFVIYRPRNFSKKETNSIFYSSHIK